MKKIYVLAIIVLLMLTACKKGSDSPTAPSAACSNWVTFSTTCKVRNCTEGNKVWFETSTGQTYACDSISGTADCASANNAVINACGL